MGVLGDAAAGAAIGSGISPGLGTIIGGAAGAIGSLGSSLLGLKSQKDTNKAQMKLAEYEWQKNLEMWNLSNAYNHPLRQLERIREAGLNPNLVYGGNSVGNSSGESPRYNAPQLKAYTDFSGVGNAATTALNVALAYRELDMKDEQKRLLSNQADAMQVESLKKLQETANEYWKTARTKFDLDLASDLRNTSMEAAQQGVNKIRQDIAESQQRVNESISREQLNKLEYDIKSKTGLPLAEAQIKNLLSAANLSYLNGSVIDFENELRDQGIDPKAPAAVKIVQSFASAGIKAFSKGINWLSRKFGIFRSDEPNQVVRDVIQGGAKVRR